MGNSTRQTSKFLIKNREEREMECVYVYVCAWWGELIEKRILKEKHQSAAMNEPYWYPSSNKQINKKQTLKTVGEKWTLTGYLMILRNYC